MYLGLVFLPLIGSITAGFFGNRLGPKGAGIITTACVFTSACLSFAAFYNVGLGQNPVYIDLFTWISSGLFVVSWSFLFDSLTVVMLIVVTVVSTLVHFYSTEYMRHDPHLPRFMSYLSLFTFFMLMLVTADNFLQLFLGWEGVGLCSYLLINFWYTRIQANKAAMKAIIVNRIGDFGLTLGILAIFYVFKALDFGTVFASVDSVSDVTFNFLNVELHALTVICLLLFVGAVGKSAQIGLHTWLPDAMEGPTPVSALIHAATMVTAGVFLILRCSALFEYSPVALTVVTIVGALTAFFAATSGLLQNDLKRVIAYSTCSQLGYMVFTCGISSYSVSLFHLMNHAFFKALLFLSAGAIIHALMDEQDMRKMGGLLQVLPFSYIMIIIGSLALMGFPFLTGFYSKDVIIELAYATYTIDGTFAHWLGSLSALFTSFYSFRLLYLTFLAKSNSFKTYVVNAHDAPIVMAIPLIILAFGSIFVGFLTKDMFIGMGTDFWQNSFYFNKDHTYILESEYIPAMVKLIPLIFSLGGTGLGLIVYYILPKAVFNFKLTTSGKKLYSFFNKKWYFDKIYTDFVVNKLLTFGYNTSLKTFDRGIIEVFGPYGITMVVGNIIQKLKSLQTGFVYHYAFVMLISVVLLLTAIGVSEFLGISAFYISLYPFYLLTILFSLVFIPNKN